MATIQKTQNNLFPLEITEVDDTALAVMEPNQSRL
jgi:hypothetical protein